MHRAIFAVGHAGAAEHGREVVDDIHVLHCLTDHVIVADIALEDFDARGPQLAGAAERHQSPHPIPSVREGPGQCEPGKSAGACDQNSGEISFLLDRLRGVDISLVNIDCPCVSVRHMTWRRIHNSMKGAKVGGMERQNGVAAHQMWSQYDTLRV